MKQPDWTSYRTILFAALVIRLVAAVFSQGYGMHDDHFLIVEAASSWADGYDYNHWLPWSPESTGMPEGHSFTYVGLNFVYFWIMKSVGISDPKILMLINRILHALFSMLIVYFGIRITEKISSRKNAVTVGWLLALLWLLPFLSVRNLVEMTCIPFILWGIWLTLKSDWNRNAFYAGLLLGMAISIRYQVGVFVAGMGLVYLLKAEWKKMFLFSAGVILVFCLTQGVVDYFIWGYPFAEFLGYFVYNSNEGTQYIPNNNYAMYLLVLMGGMLFPLGIAMGIGFFASARKYFFLFIPVILFILFHSFYPSKQERFILPVLPLFVILSVVGYDTYFRTGGWEKFWKISMRSFWVLNIPLLLLVSFTYSKKSRVEAMYYFYESGEKPHKILQEATGETGLSMLPKFYSGEWHFGTLERNDSTESLTIYPGYNYDYILFYGEQDLDKRVNNYRKLYPEMELVKRCEPSFVDRFMRWLNPRNTNEYIEVWKTHVSAS